MVGAQSGVEGILEWGPGMVWEGRERRLKSRQNLGLLSSLVRLELLVSSASEFIAFTRAPKIGSTN